ncbi:DUF6939 family protein [Deinococcus yunweiensis]|uniref:DUF6939 family protein n=1 Tax=Deinococcus yunweiensis TaxID=367282 RepID=UPI00398EF8EF
MYIHIAHHATKPASIEKKYPGATTVDVTSKGPQPWVRFSPFYPLGGIPVPFTPGRTSESVEGIWQGLKVFESADINLNMLTNRTMRNLKRTQRRFGPTLGHRAGLDGQALLPYLQARADIYLPSYRWVLNHKLQSELAGLRTLAQAGPLVLLDYETNTDPMNPAKPLSHAALVRAYLLDEWPEMTEVTP